MARMRVKITGYAYVQVADDLAKQYYDGVIGFDDVVEALQDDISEIDCGEVEDIDSKCERLSR